MTVVSIAPKQEVFKIGRHTLWVTYNPNAASAEDRWKWRLQLVQHHNYAGVGASIAACRMDANRHVQIMRDII